ncbi:MAG: DUF4160 domain-containing protein [Halobacteriovoraceae bacterium]|nr:DUF4160 domain-containing protein [Halobacteriovoraceae bacterium]
MPEISRFFGIRITMFYREHGIPHFHAEYQSFSASYDIKTGERMEGALPKKQNRLVKEWAGQHKRELLENWKLMNEKGIFKKIKGADR